MSPEERAFLFRKRTAVFLFILYVVMCLVLFYSCRPSRVSDSLIEVSNSSVSYAMPSTNILEVSNLCDSITGKPTQIQNKLSSGAFDVDVQVKDNTLFVRTGSDTVFLERVVEKMRDRVVEKIIVRYRTPKFVLWIFGVFLAILVAFIAFPSFPRFVHKIIFGK